MDIDVKTASSPNLVLIDYATATKQDEQTAVLNDIEAGTPEALGQTTMANSMPVVIASDQTAIPVADGGGSLSVDDNAGSLTVDDGGLTLSVDDGGGSLTVDGSVSVSNLPAVQSVDDNGASLTVDDGGLTLSVDDGGGSLTVDGPLTDAELRASDVPVSQSGRSVVTTVRNDYTSTGVTTGAWVQLVASLGAAVKELEIFDSSGETLEIGTGAAAAETRLIIVTPGGNGRIPVAIASATRISIRAISADASVGEIDINFYG